MCGESQVPGELHTYTWGYKKTQHICTVHAWWSEYHFIILYWVSVYLYSATIQFLMSKPIFCACSRSCHTIDLSCLVQEIEVNVTNLSWIFCLHLPSWLDTADEPNNLANITCMNSITNSQSNQWVSKLGSHLSGWLKGGAASPTEPFEHIKTIPYVSA